VGFGAVSIGAIATAVQPEGPGEVVLGIGLAVDAGMAIVGTEANVASVLIYGSATGKWDKAAVLGIQNALNFWGPLRGKEAVNSLTGHATDEMVDQMGRKKDCD
jgi:hypothetical protein